MTEMLITTADGAQTVTAENCKDGIELGIGENGSWEYASLTDAQALALAHALVGMVMERQQG